MKNLIANANSFARKAHAHIKIVTVSGDIRPHSEHLQEVADLVWASGGSDIEIAAAWLHDQLKILQPLLKILKTHLVQMSHLLLMNSLTRKI